MEEEMASKEKWDLIADCGVLVWQLIDGFEDMDPDEFARRYGEEESQGPGSKFISTQVNGFSDCAEDDLVNALDGIGTSGFGFLVVSVNGAEIDEPDGDGWTVIEGLPLSQVLESSRLTWLSDLIDNRYMRTSETGDFVVSTTESTKRSPAYIIRSCTSEIGTGRDVFEDAAKRYAETGDMSTWDAVAAPIGKEVTEGMCGIEDYFVPYE
jgi:hypothetical protein